MTIPLPLAAWALRHHVSHEALAELRAVMLDTLPPAPVTPKTNAEAYVQSQVRLEGAQKGLHLWRNNVGALKDERGVPVRYGLANDSKALNDVFKSSDLIGLRPLQITPAHVGTTVGQFVARECKTADWTYKGTDRELAQWRFILAVQALGGDAAFATGPGSL